jgi:putative Ca2+/H+ antiporter (TMEM165/GDT1 family)
MFKKVLEIEIAATIGAIAMILFGFYFVITAIIDLRRKRQCRKHSSEVEDAQKEVENNPAPSCYKYILSMMLMEMGDKCQLGGITLTIKYNGLVIAFGSILVFNYIGHNSMYYYRRVNRQPT